MNTYATVGSDTSPEHYHTMVARMASILQEQENTVRTQGRFGIEEASIRSTKEKVIIPGSNWRKPVCKEALGIAQDHASRWTRLSTKEKEQRARVVQTLLGSNLDDEAELLITYSEGLQTSEDVLFAVRLARVYGICVLDLADKSFNKLWWLILGSEDK